MLVKKTSYFVKFKRFLPIFVAILVFLVLSIPFIKLESFSDEYEQAVSGWFLLNGLLPYRDFFSHHAPLPFFLGMLAFIAPGVEEVFTLRIIVLITQVIIWLFLLASTNRKFRPVIFIAMLFSAISTPVLNLQMALADTIVYYSLLIILVFTIHRWLYGKPGLVFLAWIYILVFLICFWSTIASVLPIVCFIIIFCLMFWNSHKEWKHWRSFVAPFFFGLAGLLSFPLLYFIFGSFADFWWSVFKYNTDYYFRLHLAQNELDLKFGPLFQIILQFWSLLLQSYADFGSKTFTLLKSLVGINHLVLSGKFTEIPTYLVIIFQEFLRYFESLQSLIFLGVGLMVIYFLLEKKYVATLIFLIISMSMFFRSNEVFHLSSLFIFLVLIASVVLLTSSKFKASFSKFLPGLVLLFLAFYLIPTYVFQLKNDGPYIGEDLYSMGAFVKDNSLPSERVTVVGGNMVYYLLARRLPACKYHYYLPWLKDTPKIRNEFENCLGLRKAKLVLGVDRRLVGDVEPVLSQNYKLFLVSENVFVRKD